MTTAPLARQLSMQARCQLTWQSQRSKLLCRQCTTSKASHQSPTQQVALPALNLHTMLPREWPLARMCISRRQVNKC